MARLLKEIRDTGATVAWSPCEHLSRVVAGGTKEGGGGGFEDYGGELTVYRFDTGDQSHAAQVLGRVKTT